MDQTYLDKDGLAAAFGVSLTTVTNWVRRGCPFEERGGKGRPWKFSLPKVLAWHRQYHADDTDPGGRSRPSPDELPDILKRRPDYRNPLRGFAEDFAKDVFRHWLHQYCGAFLVFCREAGLDREASFHLFKQAAFLHITAITDAVGEDFVNKGLADAGGVDEIWFQLTRDRIVTAPPPDPEHQIEFDLPDWFMLDAGEYVARHWNSWLDELAAEGTGESIPEDGVK